METRGDGDQEHGCHDDLSAESTCGCDLIQDDTSGQCMLVIQMLCLWDHHLKLK